MTTTSTVTSDDRTASRGWLATALADQLEVWRYGSQRQSYVHAGSYAGITARWIVMPPGHAALMHNHADSALVVAVFRGHVNSILVADGGLVHESHSPGDTLIIDRGQQHLGVNPSDDVPVVLFEVGTSEHFHVDVIRHPEWDTSVERLHRKLREQFVPVRDSELDAADILLAYTLTLDHRDER